MGTGIVVLFFNTKIVAISLSISASVFSSPVISGSLTLATYSTESGNGVRVDIVRTRSESLNFDVACNA